MSKTQFYQIKDMPTYAELQALGMDLSGWIKARATFRAIRTGEMRPPKAGEWYLSGAIPEAYRTKHDLTSNYHILRLVRVHTRTVTEIV
jgi:hypothetical protein